MLGDLIEQGRGQIISRRVLPGEAGGMPVVEVSFEGTSRLLDVDVNQIGTYTTVQRPDGTLFGDGQGLYMSATGDNAGWRGQGVGHFTEDGRILWRGSIFYSTTSPRLGRLNGVAGVFEYETDESGKATVQTWEWK